MFYLTNLGAATMSLDGVNEQKNVNESKIAFTIEERMEFEKAKRIIEKNPQLKDVKYAIAYLKQGRGYDEEKLFKYGMYRKACVAAKEKAIAAEKEAIAAKEAGIAVKEAEIARDREIAEEHRTKAKACREEAASLDRDSEVVREAIELKKEQRDIMWFQREEIRRGRKENTKNIDVEKIAIENAIQGKPARNVPA